eukprot:TRINITY_DN25778_c0_g1_i1.p1 TRINITY_DN25778_c0_g1~~TRINITY_DN25778_c0_g1_i1.p1  ORF type:complete len:988 (-),score=232.70 TRINITY_DN25778_c0_g1_i1:244-3207(-)
MTASWVSYADMDGQSRAVHLMLHSDDWRIRCGAAEALARQDVTSAAQHAEAVAALLLDPEPAPRAAAAATLRRLGSLAGPAVATLVCEGSSASNSSAAAYSKDSAHQMLLELAGGDRHRQEVLLREAEARIDRSKSLGTHPGVSCTSLQFSLSDAASPQASLASISGFALQGADEAPSGAALAEVAVRELAIAAGEDAAAPTASERREDDSRSKAAHLPRTPSNVESLSSDGGTEASTSPKVMRSTSSTAAQEEECMAWPSAGVSRDKPLIFHVKGADFVAVPPPPKSRKARKYWTAPASSSSKPPLLPGTVVVTSGGRAEEVEQEDAATLFASSGVSRNRPLVFHVLGAAPVLVPPAPAEPVLPEPGMTSGYPASDDSPRRQVSASTTPATVTTPDAAALPAESAGGQFPAGEPAAPVPAQPFALVPPSGKPSGRPQVRGAPAVPAPTIILPSPSEAICQRLAALALLKKGSSAEAELQLDTLVSELSHDDPRICAVAAGVVGHIGPAAADASLPGLLRGLGSSFAFVRQACAGALGRTQAGSAAAGHLAQALSDGDPDVSRAAMISLGQLGAAAAGVAAAEQLRSADPAVRLAASRALRAMVDLSGHARHRSSSAVHRQRAAEQLLQCIEPVLSDPVLEVRCLAAKLLGRLTIECAGAADISGAVHGVSGSAVSAASVDAFVVLLKDPDVEVRLSSLDRLQHMLSSLVDAVPPDAQARWAASIAGCLQDGSEAVRKLAVGILGDMGPDGGAASVPVILGFLNNPLQPVRRAASAVLESFGGEASIHPGDRCVALLIDGDDAVRSKAACSLADLADAGGETNVTAAQAMALVRLRGDPHWCTRVAVARLLKACPSLLPAAARSSALEALLIDSDWRVQEAAQAARLGPAVQTGLDKEGSGYGAPATQPPQAARAAPRCLHEDGLREEVGPDGKTVLICDTCGQLLPDCKHDDGMREEVHRDGHSVLVCDACGVLVCDITCLGGCAS